MKKILFMILMSVPSLLMSGQSIQVTEVKIISTDYHAGDSVMVAPGMAKERKSLGFAVEVLNGDNINVTRDPNFVSSLSGKITGVQIKQPNTPWGSANIIIRGYKSLAYSNQPLFVVDGVPFDNSITNTLTQELGDGGYDYGNAAMDINTDDIESVTVLKGPAASALYGSAANGVVLITTKKGRQTKGLGLHLNAGLMFSRVDRSTMPKIQKEYGAGYGAYFDWDDIDSDGSYETLVPYYDDASWGLKFDPSFKVTDWLGVDPSDKKHFGREVPWVAAEHDMSYFFETGVRQSYNIAFDGCSEKGKFRFSYTNLGEKGVLPNNQSQKHAFDLAGSLSLTRHITVESVITYVNNRNKGRFGTGYDTGNPMQSLNQWFQTNVDIYDLRDYWQTEEGRQRTWNYPSYDDLTPIYHDNIYWTRYKNYENDGRNRVFGFGTVRWDLTSWLSLEGRAAADTYSEYHNERTAVYSVHTSGYSQLRRDYAQTNLDLIVRGSKTLGRFSIEGFAEANRRRTDIYSKFAATTGGLVVPDLYELSNTFSSISVDEGDYFWRENTLLGNVTVGYNGFVYLDITGRREASSATKGSCFYPAVSASLLISELPWIKDLKAFPFLKLRLNYAEAGNGLYAAIPLLEKQEQIALSTLDLNPEKTKSVEAGLETGFFNGRIGLDLSLYKTRTLNQIIPIGINTSTGYYTMYRNGGEIENKGIEIVLNAGIIRSPKLSWDIQLNWSKNSNKIISLYEGINSLMIDAAWDVSINAAVNQPYGVLRGYDFVYTNGRRTVDSNGYYLFSDHNDEIIGCAQPDWNAGIMTSLVFMGFTFSGLVDISQGGDLYSVDMKYGLSSGLYEETAGLNEKGNPKRDPVSEGGGMIYSEAVYADGQPNNTYIEAGDWNSGWLYDYLPTAFHVYDASYIKLRELSFGYTLPAKLLAKTPVSGVNISIVGRNLWIIHKNIPYYDPEAGFSAGNIQGIAAGAYPSTRTIGFNLKVDF